MSTLTVSDYTKLSQVMDAAQGNLHVAFLNEGGSRDDGTARSIGTEGGMFMLPATDVRDAYLRVTMHSGVERFELVSDLMERLGDTFFVL